MRGEEGDWVRMVGFNRRPMRCQREGSIWGAGVLFLGDYLAEGRLRTRMRIGRWEKLDGFFEYLMECERVFLVLRLLSIASRVSITTHGVQRPMY